MPWEPKPPFRPRILPRPRDAGGGHDELEPVRALSRDAAERVALERRRDGASDDEIAATLGCDPLQAAELVRRALRSRAPVDVADARRVAYLRQEALWTEAWMAVTAPDLEPKERAQAIKVANEVQDRLSGLLGLDAGAKLAGFAAGPDGQASGGVPSAPELAAMVLRDCERVPELGRLLLDGLLALRDRGGLAFDAGPAPIQEEAVTTTAEDDATT